MRLTPILALLALIGCGEAHAPADADGSAGDACESGETLAFTLEIVDIQRETDSGGVPGLDLDGRDSDETDELGCHQPDWTDPRDGERGVDNQLATLFVVGSPGTAPELRSGRRVDLQVRRVDDRPNDPCIEVRIDGGDPIRTELVEGRFQALGGTGSITVEMFGADGDTLLPLPVTSLAVEATLVAGGGLTDVTIAGHLNIDAMVAATIEVAPDVDPSLIRTTLEGVADLEPDADGNCQSVSAAFAAEVVP
jgi:hypothetical protein